MAAASPASLLLAKIIVRRTKGLRNLNSGKREFRHEMT
jgi:hypothetical protein